MKTLTEAIADTIYDGVPINCTCPLCEREIDVDSILSPYRHSAPRERKQWEELLSNLWHDLANSTLKEIAGEVSDSR